MKDLKIVFADGVLDELTEEEAEELQREITEAFESGALEGATPVDLDLLAECEPEVFEALKNRLGDLFGESVVFQMDVGNLGPGPGDTIH